MSNDCTPELGEQPRVQTREGVNVPPALFVGSSATCQTTVNTVKCFLLKQFYHDKL